MPFDVRFTAPLFLIAALAVRGGAQGVVDGGDALDYDFLLSISEPAEYYQDASPGDGEVLSRAEIERRGYAARVTAQPGLRAADRDGGKGSAGYAVAVRLAPGFAEALTVDEIANEHAGAVPPPVELSMVDLAGGAIMYRLLGDDAAAAVWYARLVEVSDDPINYFFYARALRALGYEELAGKYAARYAEARRSR